MYTKIKNMSYVEYFQLLKTGMFYEWYPEATGRYHADRKLSEENKFKFELDENK